MVWKKKLVGHIKNTSIYYLISKYYYSVLFCFIYYSQWRTNGGGIIPPPPENFLEWIFLVWENWNSIQYEKKNSCLSTTLIVYMVHNIFM